MRAHRWGALVATLAWMTSAAPAVGQMGMMHGPVVTAEWVEGHLADAHVAVLHADMRRSGYEEGHVPGARFLDMTRLVWDGDPAWGAEMRSLTEVQEALREVGVTDDLHHIVVYASNPLFASRAFLTLEVMGLRGRVHVLDGGLGAWQAGGRELSTEEVQVPVGDVTLTPVDGILVSADWIAERLEDPRVALIDARPDDEYTGADGGMGGRVHPGHIPGAVQMYWEELLTEGDARRFLPTGEVARVFEEAGAEEGDTVVTYCMVGWRASWSYLAARMLGYETKFFDGSWHEWGTREDLPYVSGRAPR